MRFWLFVLFACVAGCEHQKTICTAIDIADSACEMIPVAYVDNDGVKRVAYVRRSEIRAMALAHKAK